MQAVIDKEYAVKQICKGASNTCDDCSNEETHGSVTAVKCFHSSAVEVIDMIGIGKTAVTVKANLYGYGLVAVKSIPLESDVNKGGLVDIPFELIILSSLKHSRIPSLIGACIEMTELLVIQELVRPIDPLPSADLFTLLHSTTSRITLKMREVLQIAYDIADALDYLHDHCGLCHCDLTVKNILVDKSYHGYLVDFGCSQRQSTKIDCWQTLSQRRKLQGCISYMAPEIFKGKKHTPESDLFSLGVIFYELLTKARPWNGLSDVEIEYVVCKLQLHLLSNYERRPSKYSNEPLEEVCYTVLFQLVENLLSHDSKSRPSAKFVKKEIKKLQYMVDLHNKLNAFR